MIYIVVSTSFPGLLTEIRSNLLLPRRFDRISVSSPGNEVAVKHLLSNCSVLVKKAYVTRHDNALKCFIFPMLKSLNLIDRIPPWYYSEVKVKPYYENEDFRFWWNIPEFSGREENEDDREMPRPDGKLELKTG